METGNGKDARVDSVVCSFVSSFVRSCVCVPLFVGWLLGWLVGWLIDSFVLSVPRCFLWCSVLGSGRRCEMDRAVTCGRDVFC